MCIRAMKRSHRISVLGEIKPFIRFLNAYNFHTIAQNTSWRHTLHNIFYSLGAVAIIPSIPTTVILAIWYLIDIDADLKKFVVAFPLLISFFQMELTFVALLMKRRIIIETINRVEKVANQRESSHRIYEKVELKHVFINTWLVKIVYGTLLIIYVISAMFPISYAVFDYPPPHQWALPLQLQ